MSHVAHGHPAHGEAHPRRATRRALAIALALAGSYLVVEVAGAWWTGSLALLADAGHMLSDVAALALALFASWVASRPAGPRWTYGRLRAEVLAALVQGTALFLVAALIVREAIYRFGDPPAVAGAGLFAIASGGLLVNVIALVVLRRGERDNLNLRAAWLHVLSDALGSVAAMGAGLAVWLFDWRLADPIASVAISALVVASAWALLRDVVTVLMEAAPRHLDVDGIRAALRAVDGVSEVHDLHVWSVGSTEVSLSCHLVVPEDGRSTPLLQRVYAMLGREFGITHATIQVEPPDFAHETPHSIRGE